MLPCLNCLVEISLTLKLVSVLDKYSGHWPFNQWPTGNPGELAGMHVNIDNKLFSTYRVILNFSANYSESVIDWMVINMDSGDSWRTTWVFPFLSFIVVEHYRCPRLGNRLFTTVRDNKEQDNYITVFSRLNAPGVYFKLDPIEPAFIWFQQFVQALCF